MAAGTLKWWDLRSQGNSRAVSRIATLDFKKGNSDLFRHLLRVTPWIRALEGSGGQENSLIFKHHFLQVQVQPLLDM